MGCPSLSVGTYYSSSDRSVRPYSDPQTCGSSSRDPLPYSPETPAPGLVWVWSRRSLYRINSTWSPQNTNSRSALSSLRLSFLDFVFHVYFKRTKYEGKYFPCSVLSLSCLNSPLFHCLNSYCLYFTVFSHLSIFPSARPSGHFWYSDSRT